MNCLRKIGPTEVGQWYWLGRIVVGVSCRSLYRGVVATIDKMMSTSSLNSQLTDGHTHLEDR